MTITFGGSGATIIATSGTAVIASLPGGFTAGNFFLGIVATKNNATHTWPSTWNVLSQINSGTGYTVSVAWKIAVSGDTAPTVHWTGSVANLAEVSFWDNVDTFGPIGATAYGTGTGTTHACGAITTTRLNSAGVYIDVCNGSAVFSTPAGRTSEIVEQGATEGSLYAGIISETVQGTAIPAISVSGGTGVYVLQQIELLSGMPRQAADAFASWKDVPAWLFLDNRRRVDDPNYQTNPGLWSPAVGTIRPPLYSPRLLRDNGFRFDPNAQTNVGLLNAVVTSTATLRGPLVSPRLLRDFGYRTDPNAQTNAALLSPSNPTANYDWQLPHAQFRRDETWIFGPVPSTLFRPVVQNDWPLSRSSDDKRRVDPNIQNPDALNAWFASSYTILAPTFAPRILRDNGYRTDPLWQTNIELLATSIAAPATQTDWPVPKGPAQFIRTHLASFDWIAATPFAQTDWQVPKGPAQFVRTHLYGPIPSEELNPFFMTDWPLWRSGDDRRRVDPNVQLNILSTLTIPPPFIQHDWPLWRSGDDRRRVDIDAQLNVLPLLNIYPPFLQYDWPFPRSGDDRRRVDPLYQQDLAVLLNVIPPYPYNQYDWPIWRSGDDRRRVDIDAQLNLLSTLTIPPPFIQRDWPFPRGADDRRRVDADAQLNILPLLNIYPPFLQYDWPLWRSGDDRRRVDPDVYLSVLTLLNIAPPFLQHDWQVPRGVDDKRRVDWLYQTADLPNLLNVIPPLPYNQYDWPLARGYIYPQEMRTFIDSYKLTLIGQDVIYGAPGQVPTYDNPLPRAQPRRDATWLWLPIPSEELNPFFQTDWPVPRGAPRRDATWFWAPIPSTLFRPVVPTGDLSTPKGPAQFIRTHLASFDWIAATPFVQSDWPNPKPRDFMLRSWFSAGAPSSPMPVPTYDWPVPSHAEFPRQLRTYLAEFKLELYLVPFFQHDWPLPQRTAFRDHTWTWPLASEETVTTPPNAQRDWPLPGRYPPFDYFWRHWVSPALLTPPPFLQFDWPTELGARPPYPIDLHTFFDFRNPSPLAALRALEIARAYRRHLVAVDARELVAFVQPRQLIATARERNVIVRASRRNRFITYVANRKMSQAHDLHPSIDVGEEETVGFDFGPAINLNYNPDAMIDSGVTITGVPTVTASVSAISQAQDPNPDDIVLSPTIIVPSNFNSAPNAQVNVLIGGPSLVPNTTYILVCTAMTSDGQTLIDWVRWKCSEPS